VVLTCISLRALWTRTKAGSRLTLRDAGIAGRKARTHFQWHLTSLEE
jgi:hypothetical protein